MWLSKRIQDYRLQKRFPISGEYISKYEDEVEGKTEFVSAPATLRQRGNKIDGNTVMGDREWLLHGELSSSGYIHGVYIAKDPVDRGIGNFFLRVTNDRRMEGLWSGYDSENGFITSGRYIFQPLTSKTTLRPARAIDALAILRIGDDQLGDGYVDEDLIRNLAENQSALCFVAEEHGRVVGFALGQLQSVEEATAVIKAPMPRHLSFAGQVAVLKTVAVARHLHGRGIGSQLALNCLEEFQAHGIGVVYSVAWKSSAGVNIAGVLERLDFDVVAEVSNYWREESLEVGFKCPICGEPPCACSAVIYSKVLPGDGPAPVRATPSRSRGRRQVNSRA